jgi:hypothetical protein
MNVHLVVENGECGIKILVARRVVRGPWSLRGEWECGILNSAQGVATGDELTPSQFTIYAPNPSTLAWIISCGVKPCRAKSVVC